MTVESGGSERPQGLGFPPFASLRDGLAMKPMGPLAPTGIFLALVSIGLVACGTPPAQEDAAVESIGEWSISRAGPGAREGGDVEAADGGAIELRHRASQHAWLGGLLGRLHPAWSRVGRPSVVVGPEGARVRGSFGAETSVPRQAIDRVVVREEAVQGAEAKNPAAARPWRVDLVGPGGERVLPRAFGLARESDARRLAERLEAALGLGPRTA